MYVGSQIDAKKKKIQCNGCIKEDISFIKEMREYITSVATNFSIRIPSRYEKSYEEGYRPTNNIMSYPCKLFCLVPLESVCKPS